MGNLRCGVSQAGSQQPQARLGHTRPSPISASLTATRVKNAYMPRRRQSPRTCSSSPPGRERAQCQLPRSAAYSTAQGGACAVSGNAAMHTYVLGVTGSIRQQSATDTNQRATPDPFPRLHGRRGAAEWAGSMPAMQDSP